MSYTFSYVQYDEQARQNQETLKAMFEAVECYLNDSITPGRSKSLVMTKLEEAYMWTGKAIRDDQIERHAKIAMEPPPAVFRHSVPLTVYAERTND